MVSTITTFILPIEETHLGVLNEWSEVIDLVNGGQIPGLEFGLLDFRICP